MRRLAIKCALISALFLAVFAPRKAEPYIRSAYAISPHAADGVHLALELAKLGRVEDALKLFAEVRWLPDFPQIDSSEARRELAQAAGGEAQLDSRVQQMAVGSVVRVLALVDTQGKVLQAQTVDAQAPAALAERAKTLTLDPIAWPDHAIRSLRTIEFRQNGENWAVVRSYAGRPTP